MIVGTRDPFGFDRHHYHPRSGAAASHRATNGGTLRC